jgi:peptidoglycan/LPS O-acetylase OafA/YrhL
VANADGLAGRFPNSGLVVYIGLLSYSLYLWQQPFLGLLDYEPGTLILSGNWTVIQSPLLRFPLIAICTLISYYLVEHPVLQMRKRLERGWFASARTRTSVSGHSSASTRDTGVRPIIPSSHHSLDEYNHSKSCWLTAVGDERKCL